MERLKDSRGQTQGWVMERYDPHAAQIKRERYRRENPGWDNYGCLSVIIVFVLP